MNHIWKFISDYIIEPILISCRFTYLLCVFLPLIIGSPLILIGKRVPEYSNERSGTIWWYNKLVISMETAGPTFIKLAQWAASRTDIFPQEMCNRLSKLHSAVDPHPFEQTKQVIEEAFKRPFEEIFISFDMNPIGIGAIAQNFRNRRTINFPKPLIEYTKKNMLVEEYKRGLNIKLFLDNGAGVFNTMIANMGLDAFLHMLIIDNFVHADLHPGNIMVIFTKQNTYNVLRQFWINYTSSDEERSKIRYNNRDSEIAIERLLSKSHDKTLWLNEIKELCNEGYLPQLIFLDTGLVTSLNDENRRNFLDLFRAIAEFDGYKAGKLMIDRSKIPNLAIDGEIFALKMQHLVLNVKSITLQLGKIKISDILSNVLQMVRHHHVKLEGDFINIIISILLLEGIGRQLDPTMDLLKSALPIFRELGAKGSGKGVFEGIKDIPGGGALWIKFWFWLEAREWVDNASWNEYAALFHKNIWWPDL
ncbi:hypothetical protein C1645_722542 [Glomus cerebriforme]|uniref:ABC1 atypical kinase-like domain-containing protein n=1 Tax=Glomus cerebriforme TaxID=658196 RepID=A0A397TF60_9GLOM|nr:hypothetical protein C1645_722542 [Glomus cerebriforme]